MQKMVCDICEVELVEKKNCRVVYSSVGTYTKENKKIHIEVLVNNNHNLGGFSDLCHNCIVDVITKDDPNKDGK